jgi:ribonuclease HII
VRHLRPSLERERALWVEGRGLVAGIDEAGRGPLAGPVVAAAVVFPAFYQAIRGVRDSKLLAPAARVRLAVLIRRRALAVGVGAASVHEIDSLNIRRATILAMRRALDRLTTQPAHILVDGLPCPELGCPHEAIVDGDALCHSIAAASIIAKTVRDRLMQRLAQYHPAYAWVTNMGYGTPEHLAALAEHGFTAHHRKSFSPVVQMELAVGRPPAYPPSLCPSETPPAAAYSGYPPLPTPLGVPSPPHTA